jgi:hypothetical protein
MNRHSIEIDCRPEDAFPYLAPLAHRVAREVVIDSQQQRLKAKLEHHEPRARQGAENEANAARGRS